MNKYPILYSKKCPEMKEWIGSAVSLYCRNILNENGCDKLLMKTSKDEIFYIETDMISYSNRGEAARIIIGRYEGGADELVNYTFLSKINELSSLKILFLEIDSIYIESGIKMISENGDEIIIIAAGLPYYLTIIGNMSIDVGGVPEFEISDYEEKDVQLS